MQTLYVVDYRKQTKIDDSAKKEIVGDAMAEFTAWIEATVDKREKAAEARELYYENTPDSLAYTNAEAAVDPTSSSVRLPALAQSIDGTLAQQHLASFPAGERFYQLNPLNKEGQDLKTLYEKRIQSILVDIDFLVNTYKDRKNLLLDGTSCVFHPYIRKSKRKVTYQQKAILGVEIGAGELEKNISEEVLFEGTGFIPVNFNDWVCDPLVNSIDDAGFIWRRYIHKADLEENDLFDNLELAADESKNPYTGTIDTASSYKLSGLTDEGIANGYADTISDKNFSLVYEKWGDFYIDGKMHRNHVLIWSGSGNGIFHYFGENPYDHGQKPFSVNGYIPSSGTMYSKSQAHDIIPLCHELDTLINTLNDILHVTARPTFTYLVNDAALSAFFAGQPISLRPGEGIPCTTHDAIRPLVWDLSAVQEIMNSMQRIKEEIRESTGGVPYTTGGAHEQDQERTLGEVEILASGTNVRFQVVIQDYECLKLRRWLTQSFDNDKQLMSVPQTLLPTQKGGPNIIEELEVITPDMIRLAELDFEVTGSRSVLNRNRDIAELDAFIQQYVPGLVQTGAATLGGEKLIINLSEMIKARLKLTNSLRNTEQFIETEAPMPEMPMLGGGPLPPPGMPGQPQVPMQGPTPQAGPQIPPQMLAALMAAQHGGPQ